MIAALRGKLISRTDDALIIDVNGVGYEVFSASFASTPFGEEVSLHIYTDVRENAISLFGFSSKQEREVFLMLKKVKGVGSRSALAIVSTMGAEAVLVAIGREDIGQLTRVPGVGKKTAERIVVELREKVGELIPTDSLSSKIELVAVVDSSTSPVEKDAILALEKLGFGSEKAKQAVRATVEATNDPKILEDAGTLLKSALANL